ncbi:MAG: competence/damage-inducible protein A [Rhodocyclaceae bacterium]|nr:competence/damage-inducible protein A [Rhodocyclaceae bacterium]
MTSAVSGIGAIIIGDEITRGKREDKHFPKLIEILKQRGLVLDWAVHIGDDRERLTDTLRRSFATKDLVFSFGGIGNTPDDHTRQAAAAAAGVDLALHEVATETIRARCIEMNYTPTPHILEMANFPIGCDIIPNPYNRIAGFSWQQHYFVPGFPQMAWPMVEWVLDTHYTHLFNVNVTAEAAILVWKGVEGAMIPMMRQLEIDYPQVKTFSLPFLGSETVTRHVELGVRGAPEVVPLAMEVLRKGVVELGYAFDEKP